MLRGPREANGLGKSPSLAAIVKIFSKKNVQV
jgi:hypothetical protein